jgi:hypothetical protein
MDPQADDNAPQPSVEELQRRKAELEVASLERTEKFDIETEAEKRRKLFYESESLRWQTTLIYRASQFATIFTIFATLFGVYEAYDKLISDKRTEVEQRRKESTERTNAQFRSDLQSLLQYPIDKNQTISQAVFLLRDLTNVVESGFKGDDKEQAEKREQVGSLLAHLIRSPELDLRLTRNTDFDRKAMVKENSEFYANYLINNPMENRDILSKYKAVLADVHDNDPEYCEKFMVDPEDQTAFIENKASKDQTKFFQYAYLFQAYEMHVELLNRSADLKVDPHAKDYLDLAFCWFWNATKNASLIRAIFGGTDAQIKKKSGICAPPENQQEREVAKNRLIQANNTELRQTSTSIKRHPSTINSLSRSTVPARKSTAIRRRRGL